MKKTVFAGILLAYFSMSSIQARDLCLKISNNGIDDVAHNDFAKFKNVKSLKKPGSIVPLDGVELQPNNLQQPVRSTTGTAITLADGTVSFNLFGYVTGANDQLAGGTVLGGNAIFTAIDCKTFPAY